MSADPHSLVTTIRERCRICYTCVRECPAKAIRIANGQAEVLPDRCIGCGNCVKVCSQRAKRVASAVDAVERLLARPRGYNVVAALAPSFPAEWPEWTTEELVGRVRMLGFDLVVEVGFGADLVAREYKALVEREPNRRHIATTCPAVVTYVCKYQPDSVAHLAPIVSPMIATARALRRLHTDPHLRVVFVGPCIAKKAEAADPALPREVDAVLTFAELRRLLSRLPDDTPVPLTDFDPPWAGRGSLFPVSHGLLQAADISEDLLQGKVITTDGRTDFFEGLKEFESGDLDVALLEVLACSGCVMGPGFTVKTPLYKRLAHVVQRTRASMQRRGSLAGQAPPSLEGLDLSRAFVADDHRVLTASDEEIGPILERMGKRAPADELNCGACGYDTCREHARAIHEGLAESEMCLPYTIEELRETVEELARSNGELASTQQALMHSEKLASMGQLAAGIAHEVNNPLGIVLLYAHLLLEQVPEGSPLRDDARMVAEQADRCKKIVSGLLNFARQNRGTLQPTDLDELVERGMKVLPPPPGVSVQVRRCEGAGDGVAEVDADQILQVLTNLVANAFQAMPDGGCLEVSTRGEVERVQLVVKDTGTGIRKEHFKKLYEPFFTTKPPGKGTGLGLAVTYGIVKMHRGDIQVRSNADPAQGPTGTTFTVSLPRRASLSVQA